MTSFSGCVNLGVNDAAFSNFNGLQFCSPANFRGTHEQHQAQSEPFLCHHRLVHFVRFDNLHDEHFQSAVRAFGPPDYLHRAWDRRALREIDENDLIVFAKGDADQPFAAHNGDDEAYCQPLPLYLGGGR